MIYSRSLVPTFYLLFGCALVGCAAPNASNQQYDRTALSSATRTIEGEIVSKRPVTVNASSGTGAAAGGALGGIAGSSLGSNGRDNLAGAVIGVLAGAAIGAAAESSAKTIEAFEYIVRSNVAGLLTIVQTDSTFAVGNKVFVVLGSKPVIVPLNR
jgi:outer membrane lipoprotein SlyB